MRKITDLSRALPRTVDRSERSFRARSIAPHRLLHAHRSYTAILAYFAFSENRSESRSSRVLSAAQKRAFMLARRRVRVGETVCTSKGAEREKEKEIARDRGVREGKRKRDRERQVSLDRAGGRRREREREGFDLACSRARLYQSAAPHGRSIPRPLRRKKTLLSRDRPREIAISSLLDPSRASESLVFPGH